MIGVGLSLTEIAVRFRAGGSAVGDDEVSDFAISGPASVNEGDSGATNLVYTVIRSGFTAGAGSVAWATSGLSADDFVGGVVPSGVVDFNTGETSKTITVSIQGDSNLEPNENLTITLSNPATIGTLSVASASTTIVNDDTFDADAVALFGRMTNAPTTAQKQAYSDAITKLKQGPWSKLDAYWRADTGVGDQAARLNWKGSSYNLASQGSPTFVQGRDGYWSTDGSSSYLKTGFNPSIAGGNYALNSAFLSVEGADETPAASSSITEAGSASVDTLRMKLGYVNGSAKTVGAQRFNGTTAFTGSGNLQTLRGSTRINRQALNQMELYLRGKLLSGPIANTPSGLPASEVTLGFQNSVYAAKTFRGGAIGGGMTSADIAYMQAAEVIGRHGYVPLMFHLLVGQSNMAGRGTFDAGIDVSAQGLLYWATATYGNFAAQTSPQSDYDYLSGECIGMATMDGASSALQSALPYIRRMKQLLPGYHHVAIPCAVGGTGIIDDGTAYSSSNPVIWNPNPTAAGKDIGYVAAKARANAAMAWAATYWDFPGQAPSVFGTMAIIQGEFDVTAAASATGLQAAYYTPFVALIAGLRSGITGASTAPFVIGSMCSAFIGNSGAKGTAVDNAHMQAATNVPRAPFVRGPAGDGLHYYAAEQRSFLAAMADAGYALL